MSDILANPELHDEAKRLVPALAAHAQPCGKPFVMRALAPLAAVYGVGEKGETEAFWRIYYDALADLPAEALRDAVSDYTKQPGAEFFPKPGPLRALAEKYAVPIRMALGRAQRAANSLPRPVFSKEDAEQRRAAVAELLAGTPFRRAGPAQ